MIRRHRRSRVALISVAGAVAVGALSAGSPTWARPRATQAASCTDPSVTLTWEEQFLSQPEPERFIEGGGFDDTRDEFVEALCAAEDLATARSVVDEHSRDLWQAAVDRVQGKAEPGGSLSAGDDRPLYWTRLAMSAALRQWKPEFEVSDADRLALIEDLDRVSRGQDDIRFPRGDEVTRILVTGFDPFTLDRDIRQANPSGASALALDGLTVKGARGPVRIEAAMFPVRWRDFEDGMVEETLLPHFASTAAPVDAFATTSQGRVGRIDLEHFNGAWRAGFKDNENACYRGVVPVAHGLPTVEPQPQWTQSTHPFDAMIDAGTGPFPVFDNRRVVEVPAETPAEPVTTACPAAPSPGTTREDGPTQGSQARSGAGGNYLSNEIAYRATLLRDAVGLEVPGGHIHTPVLQGLSSTDRSELTNAEFEGNRSAINAQVRDLVMVVADSTDG